MTRKWVVIGALCLFTISPLLGQQRLSLQDCINIALEKNFSLQATRNTTNQAENDVRGSLNYILPTVSTSASGAKFTQGPEQTITQVQVTDSVTGQTRLIYRPTLTDKQSINSYNFNFDVSQPLFDGGNMFYQMSKSRADRNAARFNLDNRTNETIRIVAQYYIDLLKQEKLLEVNNLAMQRSQDNLDKTQKMFEIGSRAKVDVFRARVNYNNDRVSVLNQETTVKQARQTLNIALGNEPNAPLEIEQDFNLDYTLQPLETLVDEALSAHPELGRLEQTVVSRKKTVGISRSVFLPSVGGFFNYNRRNTQFDQVYGSLDQNWNTSVGVRVSMNLLNGFSDQVNYQNARISEKNARLDLEEYKLNLRANIARLYESYRNQLEVIQINRENVEASREEYRLANERFRLGSGTSLDVRDAQVNLTDAERLMVAAEYDLILTYAALREAVGDIQEAF